MATRPFNGNQGKVTIGGSNVHVTKWTGVARADILDTSDSGGSGYKTNIAGLKSFTASFDGNYDASNPPFASPPNLNPGESLAFVLFLESASGGQISGTGRLGEITVNSVVNGVVTFSANLESNGSFSLPTGTWS